MRNRHHFIFQCFRAAMLLLLSGSVLAAADHRGEIGFTLGWTYSDGVSSPDLIPESDGRLHASIGPKDSMSWDIQGGKYLKPYWIGGFLFSRQQSKLELIGPDSTREIDHFNIDQYFGTLAYELRDTEARVRPFVFGGIGAIHYGALSFVDDNGISHDIPGKTRFSGTFGGGVKLYPTESFGIRIQGRWSPTFLRSSVDGWWCDPDTGCFTETQNQYSNQVEMAAGVNFRF